MTVWSTNAQWMATPSQAPKQPEEQPPVAVDRQIPAEPEDLDDFDDADTEFLERLGV